MTKIATNIKLIVFKSHTFVQLEDKFQNFEIITVS